MFIKFTDYSDGIHDVELSEPVYDLGLEEPFFGNLHFFCKMNISGNQILLDCRINVNADLICDRCAEEFKSTYTNTFRLTYFISNQAEALTDPNVFYISPDETKIKLNSEIRDYALLSISMKKLCREDCRGLCQHCGTNLNYSACNCEQNKIAPASIKIFKKK